MKQTNSQNPKLNTIYEIIISILALIAVIIAFIDLKSGLNTWLSVLDNVILILFIVDYCVRLLFSTDKKHFIITNVLDLIAIIPFNSFFRIFRTTKLFRLAKLSKVLKLSKIVAYGGRMFKKCKNFLNTNGFKYMLLLSFILTISASIAMTYIEKMKFTDAVWWSFVTATTVGYGDLSPITNIGRIIAMILMISGIGLIGSLTSTITSFFLNIKSPSVKEETITMLKNRLDDIDNLTDEDIEDICKLLKSLKTGHH